MASGVFTSSSLDLTGTIGIAFIGGMIAMVLYGITTLQTYLYYMYYPKDRLGLKSIVATLWILETLQTSFVCHALYHYLVTNYASPLALLVGVWSLPTSILCNVIISTIMQLFFLVRVHILSKGMWWLTTLITLSILAHVAFGLKTVIQIYILKEFSKLPSISASRPGFPGPAAVTDEFSHPSLQLNAALPFAVTAVVPDVLIAGSLCYFLQSVKTGFRGTNALLNQLIIWAINRCLLTFIMAVIEVVLFQTLPGTFYYLAVDFCVGKLYANSVLATLNTRQVLRGKGFESDSLSFSNPTSSSSHSGHTPQSGVAARLGLMRGHRGRRDDSRAVELSDLRAAWPSRDETQASGDGVLVIQPANSYRRAGAEKDELGVSGIEAQERVSTERDPPHKYASFTP